ncbi:2,5-diketo-D-gluconic acid reductase [Serinibacter arcticus]|uniref:2,5-diketo-D-gluconic acid reductase n=1 Tax=Serinibacter arcticus TaxID=1655435 RepID=A0A2U1ZVU3_9MICO|nr:aldo/keto reductase [Serinibacter arcticus]PWD51084.1 2,5-diketo-D-gluconic acid reductase [Serinibacter arcticus]
MSALTDHFTLANGLEIPSLGFGTWQIPDGDDAYDAVTTALAAGYRHIDTARGYGNEASVARAIADSDVPRSDVFVTTKLPAEIKTYQGAVDSLAESLELLGDDHVDLYLIHAPWPWDDIGSDHSAGNAEAWRALEDALEDGRARSIGVSNFSVSDLEKLAAGARHRPHVNQIRYFVGHTQDDVVAYCRANGILVEGYSPLATGAILEDADVDAVAQRYGRSVAQLCLRYLLQKDVLPLPKSTTPSRIAENADLDFTISDTDLALLDALEDPTA